MTKPLEPFRVQVTYSKRGEQSEGFVRIWSYKLQQDLLKKITDGWMVTIYRLD